MSEQISVILFFAVAAAFGTAGAVMARRRGKNFLFWGVLCAIFPVCLLVIWFEKPVREVPGGFRRCPSCREFIPWKAPTCKYCGSSMQPPAS